MTSVLFSRSMPARSTDARDVRPNRRQLVTTANLAWAGVSVQVQVAQRVSRDEDVVGGVPR